MEKLESLHTVNTENSGANYSVEVENGDLIIFLGSSNTVYNSKIWRVTGVGTSIALSRAYDFDGGGGVTKLLTNDKILLLNGFNTFDFGTLGGHGQGNAEAPKKSGAELYVDPTTTTGWAYSKQKEHRSPRYVCAVV